MEGVWKLFGKVPAVLDLTLDARPGEFLVLVGPSGCGKTTSLRMLAGLEVPSYGRIWFDETDVTRLSPGKRDVAMVFQSYALYPHMSVYQNLAFGPRVRRESRKSLKARIDDVAGVLGISELLDRRPGELSGGQRQRVALGRCLIREPRLFLLDEPLSNLDAALRVQMRGELVRLHNRLGVTTVYVTHDQVEALTMGDRVAVFNQGRLLQVGAPDEVYSHPADRFVAQFIGSPKICMFDGRFDRGSHGAASLRCLDQTLVLTGLQAAAVSKLSGDEVTVGVRPHDLHWVEEAPARCTARVDVIAEVIEHAGPETFVDARSLNGERLVARFHRGAGIASGDRVTLAFDVNDLHVFSTDTGQNILDLDNHQPNEPTQPLAARQDRAPHAGDQQLSAEQADVDPTGAAS